MANDIYVGHNRVLVERKVSDLEMERWIFWFQDNSNALYIDEYAYLTRESKRHKHKPVKLYERLRQERYGGNWRIKEADVPLPEDVKSEALETFRSRITVKLWNNK